MGTVVVIAVLAGERQPRPEEKAIGLQANRLFQTSGIESRQEQHSDTGRVSVNERDVCKKTMSDFGVKMTVKNLFFDRAMVVREIGKINAAALSKAGAFVRRRARSSLRRRKKPSAPGSPPSVHSTDNVATLKNILFAYDRQRQSVVIGPVRLNVHSATWGDEGRVFTTGAVPGIHEHGGRVGHRMIKGADGKFERIPFGQRRKAERLVPVWKATAAERAASKGVARLPMRNGNGMANFYIIPNPPSVIVWKDYPARPFMGPALKTEAGNFPNLWAGNSRAAA